jgi:5-methyltetrahydropteroyltriglutamate--homocysteine methyltransferase
LAFADSQRQVDLRRTSSTIHDPAVAARLKSLSADALHRQPAYRLRSAEQDKRFALSLYPTTTIGSFPQTKAVRAARAAHRTKTLSDHAYNDFLRKETACVIRLQEDLGLDVLVHGEFERNDMVEYFGEKLRGFAFTANGWVQSYGSRCVKPPLIFGDISRSSPMTVQWTASAQVRGLGRLSAVGGRKLSAGIKWRARGHSDPYAHVLFRI